MTIKCFRFTFTDGVKLSMHADTLDDAIERVLSEKDSEGGPAWDTTGRWECEERGLTPEPFISS